MSVAEARHIAHHSNSISPPSTNTMYYCSADNQTAKLSKI